MSTRAAAPETEDIADQLKGLSVGDQPESAMAKSKKKPRMPKQFKQKEKKRVAQQNVSAAPFQSSRDKHAAFPPPLPKPSAQIPQQKQPPNLFRYVPTDSRPDTSFDSSIYQFTQPFPPPRQSVPPHPSTFFTPSYQREHTPSSFGALNGQAVPFFSQHLQQSELPQTPAPRRSARLSARQAYNQQSDFNSLRSELSETPSTSGRASEDPEVRTPRTSDKRARRVGALLRPAPSASYLEQTMKPPKRLDAPRSLLVVLDLNGVLIHRGKRKKTGYTPRPNLDAFFDYLFANHNVMIWSSGMPLNVVTITEKLFPPERRKKLVDVWARDRLRLPANLYDEKVQVYKQLSWIWEDMDVQSKAPLRGWSQKDTVLIDDSIDKAAAEPHNLIEVDEFTNADGQQEDKALAKVVDYLEHLRWYEDVSAAMREKSFALYGIDG